jgi:hypothetical protein
MWNWITDPRNLRQAWRRIASNKGKRFAGVDGMTVARIRAKSGEQRFLEELRADLRSGAYRRREADVPTEGHAPACDRRYPRCRHWRPHPIVFASDKDMVGFVVHNGYNTLEAVEDLVQREFPKVEARRHCQQCSFKAQPESRRPAPRSPMFL